MNGSFVGGTKDSAKESKFFFSRFSLSYYVRDVRLWITSHSVVSCLELRPLRGFLSFCPLRKLNSCTFIPLQQHLHDRKIQNYNHLCFCEFLLMKYNAIFLVLSPNYVPRSRMYGTFLTFYATFWSVSASTCFNQSRAHVRKSLVDRSLFVTAVRDLNLFSKLLHI
jgi:hypothetical protein